MRFYFIIHNIPVQNKIKLAVAFNSFFTCAMYMQYSPNTAIKVYKTKCWSILHFHDVMT